MNKAISKIKILIPVLLAMMLCVLSLALFACRPKDDVNTTYITYAQFEEELSTLHFDKNFKYTRLDFLGEEIDYATKTESGANTYQIRYNEDGQEIDSTIFIAETGDAYCTNGEEKYITSTFILFYNPFKDTLLFKTLNDPDLKESMFKNPVDPIFMKNITVVKTTSMNETTYSFNWFASYEDHGVDQTTMKEEKGTFNLVANGNIVKSLVLTTTLMDEGYPRTDTIKYEASDYEVKVPEDADEYLLDDRRWNY